MPARNLFLLGSVFLILCARCTSSPAASTSTPMPATTATSTVLALTITPTEPQPIEPTAQAPDIAIQELLETVSSETLLSYLEELTAFEPHSGWRSAGTRGEAQALDYVESVLSDFTFLQSQGLTSERQTYRIFNAVEIQEAALYVSIESQEYEISVDGIRPNRHNNYQALYFDSDGKLNDRQSDPLEAQGDILSVNSQEALDALSTEEVSGRILFVRYDLLDRHVTSYDQTLSNAQHILNLAPAGVVIVTQFSNEPGESHGTFAADGNPFILLPEDPARARIPILTVCLEELANAGVESWESLEKIQSARLVWDADVISPAESGNLIARIPGQDPNHAVILGAHIDSPNSPGALDDGTGSALLLEVARVLNENETVPPVDLYLAWFGSEEVGAIGAAHFAATHQDLLDRTIAMLQTDMLSYPLNGIDAEITLNEFSYGRLGDERTTWADYLVQTGASFQINAQSRSTYDILSDNTVFEGFNVPNLDVIYESQAYHRFASLHYAAHVHEQYDTIDLVRPYANVLVEMTRLALLGALQSGLDLPDLRVTPAASGRAVFVGTHTEMPMMTPTGLMDLGQALAWEGLDVDLVPYGQTLTAADLQDAKIVFVLPLLDLPGQGGNNSLYEERWSEEEIHLLEQYAANGGLLVLTNSAHRLDFNNRPKDDNEDWWAVNELSERFGIRYMFGSLHESLLWEKPEQHPLLEGVTFLKGQTDNGIPLAMKAAEGQTGTVLVRSRGKTAVGLLSYSSGGEVLALADLALLGNDGSAPMNQRFWQNLARYALQR